MFLGKGNLTKELLTVQNCLLHMNILKKLKQFLIPCTRSGVFLYRKKNNEEIMHICDAIFVV